MISLAIKMLTGDRLKYPALIAGVAFASLLITQQASIFTGYARSTGAWIRDTAQADLWVMDPQVNFSEDFKPMSDTALNRVRGVHGVAWAVPMFKSYVRARLPDGTRVQVRIIGLDDATLTGAPPEMVQGDLGQLRRDRAVLMNVKDAGEHLALKHAGGGRALRVGDHISLNENDAVVTGTYRATREFFWDPVLYTTYSRALAWAPKERRVLTYVLVRVAAGHDPAEVAARIFATTGQAALTREQFERRTMWDLLLKTGILVNFGITIALGFVIGLLVAGLTFYTFVLDNLKQFGALKAMGTSNGTVLRMMLAQVLVVAGIGFGIGIGGAAVTGILFTRGGLSFEMPWQVLVFGAAAVLICCMAAGMLGMVRVIRLEPAVVFKG